MMSQWSDKVVPSLALALAAVAVPSAAHATNVIDLAFIGTFATGPSAFSGQSLAAHVIYDAGSPVLARGPVGSSDSEELLSFASPLLYELKIGGANYLLNGSISFTTQTTYYDVYDGKRFYHSEMSGFLGDFGDYKYYVRLFSDGYGLGNSPIQPADVVGQQNGALVLNFAVLPCWDAACTTYNVPEHSVASTVLVYAQDVTVTPVTTAVPEPSIWAMLIVGFGASGAALRRRQRLSARASFN
jgi:hypothetical protein